ncbi:MAG: RNA methyltransferase [Methanocellales archaeon]
MSKLNLRVILVEPKYEGNIGSIARVMKNFGFEELVLVKPPQLGDFARAMASHAFDVLEKARKVDTLDEAIMDVSLIIATTAVKSGKCEFKRRPVLTPEQLRKKLEGKKGKIALLFGREDTGLINEVIEKCDIVVNIPANPVYPVMNLAQAAGVILYELSKVEGGEIELASHRSLEQFYSHIEQLLEKVEYPKHKRRKTMLMLRRICGRAELTEQEIFTLHGILRSIEWMLEHKK